MTFLCYCSRHDRKKPLLFYFNILKCASPLVLLELQCPTTQVRLPLSHMNYKRQLRLKHDLNSHVLLTLLLVSSCVWSVVLTGTSPW